MRRSELLALRWCDLDLLLCQASVSRTLHQLHNREIIFQQPKTSKSRRSIALSPSAVAVLRDHWEAQKKLRQALGVPLTDDDLVFCQLDGKPLLPDSVTQAWRNLAKRAGLHGTRFKHPLLDHPVEESLYRPVVVKDAIGADPFLEAQEIKTNVVGRDFGSRLYVFLIKEAYEAGYRLVVVAQGGGG